MIDSSKGLSSALNDNVQKISTATGGLEQLLRKTVPGYQANAEFERGLRQLNAGLDKGRISMSLAADGLSGLISRYGQSRNSDRSGRKRATEAC